MADTAPASASKALRRVERDAAMVAAYQAGRRPSTIAHAFRLTHQRVYQILHRQGIATTRVPTPQPVRAPHRCRHCTKPFVDHTPDERILCRRATQRAWYHATHAARRAYQRAYFQRTRPDRNPERRAAMIDCIRRYQARLQEQTRAHAVKRGAPWRAEDERFIVEHQEMTIRDLALALGRTSRAILVRRRRLRQQGRLPAENRDG